LIGNETGFFALVGCVAEPTWSSLETVVRESFDDAVADDEELDFEMF